MESELIFFLTKCFRKIKLVASQVDPSIIFRLVLILFIILSVNFEVSGKESPVLTQAAKLSERQASEKSLPQAETQVLSAEVKSVDIYRLKIDAPPMASISAQTAFVVDHRSGAKLFAKDADRQLPMASLTKLMTALVVLDKFSLADVITVPEVCSTLPPANMGLKAQEKLTVESLLYGMLVSSGADASCALSHSISSDFVKLMNDKAQALSLANTHFENETGFDGENGHHQSSARDLVHLTQEVLKSGELRKIVGTRQVAVSDISGTYWHQLTSTNELLGLLPGLTGVKTGYTESAGECLAFSYEQGGREIVGVILGSNDRFGEAQNLISWVFKAYEFPL